MSNCWLSRAVLQSAWKHTHDGEEIYPPRTKKAGKRGNCLFQLLCHFLSYSIIWIFPSSHSGSTSTSGFISASRCFLWQPNSSSFAPAEAPVIWTVDNSPQTLHRQMIICLVLANELSCLWEKTCFQPPRNAGMLYCMNITIKTMFAEEWAALCVDWLL